MSVTTLKNKVNGFLFYIFQVARIHRAREDGWNQLFGSQDNLDVNVSVESFNSFTPTDRFSSTQNKEWKGPIMLFSIES